MEVGGWKLGVGGWRLGIGGLGLFLRGPPQPSPQLVAWGSPPLGDLKSIKMSFILARTSFELAVMYAGRFSSY